jgi:hypothetical protein
MPQFVIARDIPNASEGKTAVRAVMGGSMAEVEFGPRE